MKIILFIAALVLSLIIVPVFACNQLANGLCLSDSELNSGAYYADGTMVYQDDGDDDDNGEYEYE